MTILDKKPHGRNVGNNYVLLPEIITKFSSAYEVLNIYERSNYGSLLIAIKTSSSCLSLSIRGVGGGEGGKHFQQTIF